jgi:phenylalanyl-tRNA synthetase alpha subunit
MDVNHARICGEFIEEVKRKLTPGKFALVAEVSEDSASPVDLIMKGLGGTAFRRALKEVRHAKHVRKVRAIKAELARIKAEQAGAHANRKAKFGKKLNQLDSKIQSQLENRKRRRGAAAAKEKAQSKALQAKAARMKADASVKPL